MRVIFVVFVASLLMATVFAKEDECEKLCKTTIKPGICGKSVDHNTHCEYKFFVNYCELRKHNCRNKKDRYQAELDLVNCPGKHPE